MVRDSVSARKVNSRNAPYDGENTHSILVMDNCSIHHVQPVLDTLKQMGILVLLLPPYSPDMNPIEEMFSYIKYYLKDHDPILQALDDPVPLIEASFESYQGKMYRMDQPCRILLNNIMLITNNY